MKALLFSPGAAHSARLEEVAEPARDDSLLKVKMRAVGVCGTDRELLAGTYGWAPPGKRDLVIGHESIGTVVRAPERSGFAPGDWVVGIVRHPDPVPCANCAIGEWDMCRNGGYTEHGIKERDGFCREFYELDPRFAVKVDPSLGELGVLLEPASVVAKAWDHIERIGGRAVFAPKNVVVTGAGPIGLLAALLGAQRKLEVHVLDRVKAGPKVEAVRALGAHYHSDMAGLEPMRNRIDLVVECTGSDRVVFDMIELAGPNSIVCLAGVSSGGRQLSIDFGAMNKSMVLENEVVFGTVNANRRHYELGAEALRLAPREWLARLITRRVPLSEWSDAFAARDDQIKVAIVADGASR